MFTNVVSTSSRNISLFASDRTILNTSIVGGYVSLNSTNPFDQPVISPNLLATEFDIFNMREALKSARRFMAAPAWSDWIIGEYGAFAQAQTDDELDAYIRAQAYTNSHGSCTVPMGKTGNDTSNGSGALNSDLTVKQTVGLRVVDSTVFVSFHVSTLCSFKFTDISLISCSYSLGFRQRTLRRRRISSPSVLLI